MHEFKLIRKYFSNLTNSSKSSLNLNDDVFFDKTNKLVVSIDTYIEGSHFVNFNKPELVIKKVVRSSISDLILTHLDKLFQVIIKCAVFEFLYKPKTSSKIIIKEYLNASNFFLDDSQTKYLNALLDKISKKIRISDA